MSGYIVRGRRKVAVVDENPPESEPAPLSPIPCTVGHVEGSPCMWCHGTMWLIAENNAEPAMARHNPDEE